MKVMVQATVIFQWTEDSDDWSDKVIQSEDDLIAAAQEYASEDHSYILDCEPVSVGKIEKVKS